MSLAERVIWRNGKLVPWGEVTVHVLSQSLQRGTLVFDVMPVYWLARGPAILGLDEHLARFEEPTGRHHDESGLREGGVAGGRGRVLGADEQNRHALGA